VQSGEFWQEIDGSPVFHLCERKHRHNARQWYWHIAVLLQGEQICFRGRSQPLRAGWINPWV